MNTQEFANLSQNYNTNMKDLKNAKTIFFDDSFAMKPLKLQLYKLEGTVPFREVSFMVF